MVDAAMEDLRSESTLLGQEQQEPTPGIVQQDEAQTITSSSVSDPPTTSDPTTSSPEAATVSAIAYPPQANGEAAAAKDNRAPELGQSAIAEAQPPAQQNPQSNDAAGQERVTEAVPNGASSMRADVSVKLEKQTPELTPSSARGKGSGRGRPRGRGRGGGGGRGGKRKRGSGGDEDDADDGSSSESEVYSPVATMTKSGRSVQKPASYVPPPPPAQPPPVAHTNKRKRVYRRNPDSAVCKVCLRGTSPASNQIVFCDGCNSPYHQFCHHPPIEQDVITDVDKEWLCRACERERIVPEADVMHFVPAPAGASVHFKRRYFSALDKGMLVTLLTRATSLHPDLPVFGPEVGEQPRNVTLNRQTDGQAMGPPTTNGGARATPVEVIGVDGGAGDEEEGDDKHGDGYGSDHPPNYPRPGQGLMTRLPPESNDGSWLVDDHSSVGVFNHFHR